MRLERDDGIDLALLSSRQRRSRGRIGYLDHDVIDSTSLEGSWDFDLEWTGRGVLAAKGPDGISVFTAVDKQLGLKLDKTKRPYPVLVIDHMEETPTAN